MSLVQWGGIFLCSIDLSWLSGSAAPVVLEEMGRGNPKGHGVMGRTGGEKQQPG